MNTEKLVSLAFKHANFEAKNVHVSIITHKNKVIAVGSNNYIKTSPAFLDIYKDKFNRLHSEAVAIKKARYYRYLNKCSLWNFRFSRRDNGLLLSMPCENCMKLIQLFELRSVYFSTPYGVSKL